jgi:hypothetical protein
VAVVLGVISVWLIVTRNSVTGQRIGALAGFWGLLLGASALSAGRRPGQQPDPVDAPAAADVAVPGGDVELGTSAALERAAEADARREFEVRLTARLEGMLRQEVQQSVGQEIHALRNEIAALRSELVEQVGGRLRLERIETTRVIGSDLEAPQHGTSRTVLEPAPLVEPARPARTVPAGEPAPEPPARHLAGAVAQQARTTTRRRHRHADPDADRDADPDADSDADFADAARTGTHEAAS